MKDPGALLIALVVGTGIGLIIAYLIGGIQARRARGRTATSTVNMVESPEQTVLRAVRELHEHIGEANEKVHLLAGRMGLQFSYVPPQPRKIELRPILTGEVVANPSGQPAPSDE